MAQTEQETEKNFFQMYKYKIIIDDQNLFDQPVKSDMRTYDIIQKITNGPGDDYATGCLLDYSHFNDHYKIIAIDLSKQQALDAHLKAIQQINFTRDLNRRGGAAMFPLLKKKKPFQIFQMEL